MGKQTEYVIHNEEGESASYSVIVESSVKKEDNALRLVWVSDAPSNKDVCLFITERHPELKTKNIERIYHDDVWHFTKDGRPYGVIVVFFED